MRFPDVDQVAIQLGALAIHWYGIAYVVGIVLAWRYARHLVSRDRLWLASHPPMQPMQLDDFVFWAAIGIVAGGRIGYIIFYDFATIASSPLRAFAIWNGGMSFHGGALGVAAAMTGFASSRRIPVLALSDVLAASAPIGLFFGRIANFINGELWGLPSTAPWAVIFPEAEPVPRHPSQLYEAGLEGILLFLILMYLVISRGYLRRPGRITGAFVVGYGVSRIFVEFFREPDPQLGYLAFGYVTMGMVLSLPMVILGLWFMWFMDRRRLSS